MQLTREVTVARVVNSYCTPRVFPTYHIVASSNRSACSSSPHLPCGNFLEPTPKPPKVVLAFGLLEPSRSSSQEQLQIKQAWPLKVQCRENHMNDGSLPTLFTQLNTSNENQIGEACSKIRERFAGPEGLDMLLTEEVTFFCSISIIFLPISNLIRN